MPSFKPKPTKKIVINKKDVVTLDEKHKEFMNHFSFDENVTIPKLRKYRKNLKKKLELLTSKLNVKTSDTTWNINEKIEVRQSPPAALNDTPLQLAGIDIHIF